MLLRESRCGRLICCGGDSASLKRLCVLLAGYTTLLLPLLCGQTGVDGAATRERHSIERPPLFGNTTVSPLPSKFLWPYTTANGTVIILLSVVDIVFNYPPGSQGEILSDTARGLTAYYGLPKLSGRFSPPSAYLSVVWSNTQFPEEGSVNFTIGFHERVKDGVWLASRFMHQRKGDSIYVYGGQDYFKTPFYQAFHCNNRTTYSVDALAQTSFRDLTVQAFYFTGDEFSKQIVYCPANSDPRSLKNVVLIAAVSAFTLLVLGAVACVVVKVINSKMHTTATYESL